MPDSFEGFYMKNRKSYFWAWSSFFLSSLFYLYEFCLQVSPASMTDLLMRFFKTDSVGVGFISGFYFYSYAMMQIPVGMIYDRFSTRGVLSIANFICALSIFIFISTQNVFIACFARFLMGLGSAFAFVSVIIFVNCWFSPVHFAALIGVAQMMSSLGAIVSETPLIFLIDRFGWKEVFLFLAAIGVLLGTLTWFFAKDGPREIVSRKRSTWQDEKQKLAYLFKHSQTWALAAYNFFTWVCIPGFAGLWGVPYLKTVYHLSEYAASEFCILIWFTLGVASIVAGILSDKFKNRKQLLTILAAIGLLGSVLLVFFPTESHTLLLFSILCIGFSAGGQALSFAVINDIHPTKFLGTASGINNMAVVVVGAIFQPLIGIMLSAHSTGEMFHDLPVYTASDYQAAMICLPICFLGALFSAAILVKESYPK